MALSQRNQHGRLHRGPAGPVGPPVIGLIRTNVVRLKESSQQEWGTWSKRSLEGKYYVYLWADGIHFNIRMEDPGNNKQCILVLMGATSDGRKELNGIAEGYRESAQSWRELLLDVKNRGLSQAAKLATGDGALGFWAALREIYPATQEQRCWVHKTANVLNKLPKSLHAKAKSMLHDIWMAETRKQADTAFDLFITTFEAKYPKAIEDKLQDGLSRQRIYQDLTEEYGFGGSYYSVRRFVKRFGNSQPIPFRRMECMPGLSRSACGGEAPTSYCVAHSHAAAGPSDTDLDPSGTGR